MQDKPSASILLEAVSDFLLKEILPFVKDNEELSYKTLVSWNTLQILSREWKLSEKLLDEELQRLVGYFHKEEDYKKLSFSEKRKLWQNLGKELSLKIRNYKISNSKSVEWDLVKKSLRAKLEITNPKFL